ncbi:MAG: hypothetical protein ABFD07_19100 [Methanobacterium sp.]
MTKIVINTGSGFDLTHKAVMRYAELKGIKLTAYQRNPKTNFYELCKHPDPNKNTAYLIDLSEYAIIVDSSVEEYFSIYNIKRDDPVLIQVTEELNDSEHLDLKIVEIPDDVEWIIQRGETGAECVREVTRIWE